jgi:hypothetical protein
MLVALKANSNSKIILMNIKLKLSLIVVFMISSGWGFFGHENIDRLAIFTLPPEMIPFYKKNIHYIVEASVNPDKRRYAVPEEGPRHYIDLDEYGNAGVAMDTLRSKGNGEVPIRWTDAVAKFGEDSLMLRGIVPWHSYKMYLQLREAFMLHNIQSQRTKNRSTWNSWTVGIAIARIVL